MLARYGHVEDVPSSVADWDVPGLRGAEKLATTLRNDLALALLFRRIATVDTSVEVGSVDDWVWTGPTAGFQQWAERLEAPDLAERAAALAARRAG